MEWRINMQYDITDFVDLTSDKTCDVLHMCKRVNNNKRDYLFVNDSQGKHIPATPAKVLELFGQLYDKVYNELKNEKKILMIGFAETATAISETLYRFSVHNEYGNNLDVVYYLQTTREENMCQNEVTKLFSFDEEHSHAVNQNLYIWNDMKDSLDFDTVLFVDDEITTGKTILNFIESFENLKKGCRYYVASIANWQNDTDRNIFAQKDIGIISLYTGKIKSDIKPMVVKQKKKDNYFDSIVNKISFEDLVYHNPRFGLKVDEVIENKKVEAEIALYLCSLCHMEDRVEVVGTEEFMEAPLKISYIMNNYLESPVRFHSTTRSPIMVSEETSLYNGKILPSAYDKDRKTYLYNLRKSDKVFIMTEKNASFEFCTAITICYMDLGIERKNIFIVEI